MQEAKFNTPGSSAIIAPLCCAAPAVCHALGSQSRWMGDVAGRAEVAAPALACSRQQQVLEQWKLEIRVAGGKAVMNQGISL